MATRYRIGKTEFQKLVARDVDGARQEILNLVKNTSNGSTIYFDGWRGLGTAAVLRSVVQVLQSKKDSRPELCFDRIIFIDCSTWISKRVMQRRIAEELKLDPETMAIFHKQDEEDDFNGVDPTSRDAIRDVATVINRTLMRDSKLIIIFLNGSDEEVVLRRLGVPEYQDNIIIWTFKRRFPSKGPLAADVSETLSKLRYPDIIFGFILSDEDALTGSEISALVREEAASILTRHPHMLDDDQAMITDCYLYGLFLHHSFHKGTNRLWAAHGANYWICDGIIQGARTREISKALYQEVSFECDDNASSSWLKRETMLHPDSSYLVLNRDYPPTLFGQRTGRRWISITSKDMVTGENIKSVLEGASSIILPFEITDSPHGLPNDLMEQCSNLRVLILSYCAFNFLSPLFRHCHTLRFLGLDHCRNSYTTELVDEREDYTANKWACLHSLLVLDLRHTDWDEILSEEKLDLMGNMMELNIEGSRCWQYTAGQLKGRLPYLERLRIVKPLCQAEASSSMEIDGSFMGKTKLQILDLSGNKHMKKLPASLSEASSLEVLVLDGCDGLENVVLSNSSLRSFSFDGYGPASNWTSMVELPPASSRHKRPDDDDKKDVEISKISLEGCTRLENLFLRGLPNLVELDLSGCAIKILDLETMLVDVPRLKRLFLLGCEHLRAVRWGPPTDITSLDTEMTVHLELLCIDTRAGDGVPGRTRPSITHQPNTNSFGLQVHAVSADARLVRSLWPPIHQHAEEKGRNDVFFDIRITSSNTVWDEKTSEEHHVVAASLYDDVSSSEVGDSSLTPMQAFPQPPTPRLDRHLEIGDGSRNVGSEVQVIRTGGPDLLHLMRWYVQSVHAHDTSTSTAMPPTASSIKWCRVERCPRLDPVFPPRANPCDLETIWASDLLMARCIWSKGPPEDITGFRVLRRLHLRCCPSLRFALPIWTSSFPMLENLHIVHCGSLRHVFALDNKEYERIFFRELTTIHLHDVPALRQICETNKMIAPKLKSIKTRGCWSLRRLPALEGRGRQERRPSVEMEKDVWDALEWDGADPAALYEAPLHSRYYKRKHLLRGSVLR